MSGYTLYHNVCLMTYQLVLFIDDDDNIVRIVFVIIKKQQHQTNLIDFEDPIRRVLKVHSFHKTRIIFSVH